MGGGGFTSEGFFFCTLWIFVHSNHINICWLSRSWSVVFKEKVLRFFLFVDSDLWSGGDQNWLSWLKICRVYFEIRYACSMQSSVSLTFRLWSSEKPYCRCRKQKRKDKIITVHVPTPCDWLSSSASAFVTLISTISRRNQLPLAISYLGNKIFPDSQKKCLCGYFLKEKPFHNTTTGCNPL